ncbi:hypothetical protein TD95_002259 [Thielaviopsis punctulata]|uniref:MT-A70-domain-containing protein n=1 Tax=Thielaviopsis punctulata TaxID=72032 RepID=A0A0F4ZJF7_9PEZI|nr:hypothetical protein TD95_002259 [Thielaviopsis punctulata]
MTAFQSSVLYTSRDRSIVCIDIPRSLEEAQALPGQLTACSFACDSPPSSAAISTAITTATGSTCSSVASPPCTTPFKRRIRSVAPIKIPFATPDPQRGNVPDTRDPAAQLAELMAQDTVERALEILQHEYTGPLCLPRLTLPESVDSSKLDLSVSENTQDASEPLPAPYHIPPKAIFVSGRIQDTLPELAAVTLSAFDLIVLDPPWANRSARRKRRRAGGYSTFSDLTDTRALLSQIPISSRLAPGGIVAVWITNKHTLFDLMTAPHTGVFASWGVEMVAEWLWLKVTMDGQPVVDVASTWRKPWEKLLIAQRPGERMAGLQQGKVLVSVPDVHSRKPNLRSLFGDMLGSEFRGLEVFARNLTAGWCSWGDEVLKFQEHKHWEVLEVLEKAKEDLKSKEENTIKTCDAKIKK